MKFHCFSQLKGGTVYNVWNNRDKRMDPESPTYIFILQFKKYKIARNESLYDKFYKPLGQRVKLALAFGQYAPIGQSTSVGDVEDSGQ